MITQKEYAKRRNKFAKQLQKESVALFLSAMPKERSHDTEYPYRQNSNFYYLSGFKEDNAALLFVKTKEGCNSYLFVQKKEPKMELWTGKRLGVERAKELFAVDDVFTFEALEEQLSLFGVDAKSFYYDFQESEQRIAPLKKVLKNLRSCHNAALIVEYARLIKSSAEIALIKKAISITKEAHHCAMQCAKKLSYEYELQAELEYVFKKNGAYSDAYTSIVACANAANTLHYISNNNKLIKNELILIDAGCEYEYYASDITRTIPVSGKFTKAQKELYTLVLEVNKSIISMIRPGVLRSDLQKKSEELLCRGLVTLGILHGNVSELLVAKAHKKYYPHGIGHWMGLDVHDASPYRDENGDEIPLKAGMVLTIEPGIYVDSEDRCAPKKYRGIGIRIEDDILVTKKGFENLSCDVVKEIDDIIKK